MITIRNVRRVLLCPHLIIGVLGLIGSHVASAQELHAQITPQLGHSAAVLSVTFSSNGKLALTGGGDSAARLWDVTSGRELRQFTGHSLGISDVEFSSDGKSALTTARDNIVRVWNVLSGQELRQFKVADDGGRLRQIYAAQFADEGRTIIALDGSGSNVIIRQWDVSSGKELRSTRLNNSFNNNQEKNGEFLGSKFSYVSKAFFSRDGKTILSANNEGGLKAQVAYLWDTATGEELHRFDTGQTQGIFALSLSPDGRTAITASFDKTIRLWDVESGRELSHILDLNNYANSLSFSPDGRVFAAALTQENTVLLVDVVSGRELHRINWEQRQNYRAGAWGTAFSPDGSRIMIGAQDGSLRLHRVQDGGELRRIAEITNHVNSLALSPDQKTIFLGTYTEPSELFDLATGHSTQEFAGHLGIIRNAAFSPDGNSLLTASYNEKIARLWDLKSGRELQQLAGHDFDVISLAFSADGKNALTGSIDGRARLWDVEHGGQLRQQFGSKEARAVTSVAFSPDQKSVMATGMLQDIYLKLYDLKNGRELRTITRKKCFVWQADFSWAAVFSPNGRSILTGDCDGIARLWDLNTGRELRQFNSGQHFELRAIAFSPDGRTVLTGTPGNVVLWDTASGNKLVELKGHQATVNSVAFTQDGSRILTASNDGTVRIWDAKSGAERASIITFLDGSWLTITPEGFFDASSPKATQGLSIVRGLEVSSVDQVYNALYRPDLVREKLAGDPSGKVKAAAALLDLDKVMASGMAPKPMITSPAPGSSSATDEVAVEATIADQGGGIGKVEWRVNGVTLGLESRGLERIETPAGGAPGSDRVQTVKRTLSLEPGDNRIEVMAYNAKGLIASEPAQVTVKWDGAKTASPPKLYVLAVGVNDYYDSRLHLAYAVPDATALADAFRKAGTGLYASVDVKTVLDIEVTVANLDKVVADLSTKVQPRDVFVFFLAGHGKTENGRYYFLPRDFRYEDESSIQKAGMGQDKFQAWLAEIPARKSILLYDTCESGSLTGATRGSDIDERLGALNRMARATGRTFLTATTDDAPALEGFHGHGVFTYALLDAFDKADVKHDGLIEISELADYIDRKVPDYSYEAFKLRQIPQRSIVGNNFALTNKAEVLAAAPADAAGDTNIFKTPTHVIVAPTDVKTSANDTSPTVAHLSPGTQVRLMEMANGWVLIARDGQKLGYLPSNAIAGLQ